MNVEPPDAARIPAYSDQLGRLAGPGLPRSGQAGADDVAPGGHAGFDPGLVGPLAEALPRPELDGVGRLGHELDRNQPQKVAAEDPVAAGRDVVGRAEEFGAIDQELTAQSYIVPGLGDAGDLAFGDKL